MRDYWVPKTGFEYTSYLIKMRSVRKTLKANEKTHQRKRQRLSKPQRQIVFEKTDGRCHICGDEIDGSWDADHVLSHSKGGEY